MFSLHKVSMWPPPNLNSRRVHVQHPSKCTSENKADEKEQHDRDVCSKATGGTYDHLLPRCTKLFYMTMQSEDDYAFGMLVWQMFERKIINQTVMQISAFARIFNCPRVPVQNAQRKSGRKLLTILTHPKEWQEHCLKRGYDRLDASLRVSHSQSSIYYGITRTKTQTLPTENDRERHLPDHELCSRRATRRRDAVNGA